jgi:hypothetical protein
MAKRDKTILLIRVNKLKRARTCSTQDYKFYIYKRLKLIF